MGYAKKMMPEDFPEHCQESVKALEARYNTTFTVIQRWRKEMGIQSMRKKQVLQIDKDVNLVAIWDSISDAGKAMYVSYTAIGQCCRRKSKTSCGYIWRFSGDADDILPGAVR